MNTIRQSHGLLMTAVAFFAFSQTAEANKSVLQQNMKRLLEGTTMIMQAHKMAKQGNRWQAKTKLRIASYRLRIAKTSLDWGSVSGAVGAIDVAIEKIQDRGLRVGQKVRISLDCIGVAMGILGEELAQRRAAKKGAILTLRFVKKISHGPFFGIAGAVLDQALTTLSYGRGHRFNSASDAVEIALEKATDSGLTRAQKKAFVLDCVNVAIQSLRS